MLWDSLSEVKSYGERLRELRTKMFESQEAMAAAIGRKRQGNLPLYENDKKHPSVRTVLLHAAAFRMKPSEFLKDVAVTEFDRIKAGDYDGLRPAKSSLPGEGQAPTRSRRQAR